MSFEEQISAITQSIIHKFQETQEELDNTKKITKNDVNDVTAILLLENKISLNEPENVLEEAVQIDLLSKQKIESEKTQTEERQRIAKLKKKISTIKEKLEALEEKKDQILFYKLLTGIHLSYDEKNVTGCAVGSNIDNIKCFELPPKIFTKDTITTKIYDAIFQANCTTNINENLK